MATEALLPYDRHEPYDFISPTKGLKDAAKGLGVIVTGSGTGCGKATAYAFAQAGASCLILAARRVSKLEETRDKILKDFPDCKVLVFGTDITKVESVNALFSGIGDVVPDVLINNVGTGGSMKRVDEGGDEEIDRWWSDFEINTKGAYIMTRAYLKLLGGRKGRIINLSSNGSWKLIPGLSGYSMSKASINRFCEFVDQENKDSGTRCFALHPGGVAGTDLTSQTGAPEWLMKQLIDKPELSAATALYLTTERSNYLGGRYVLATWDMEKLEELKSRIEKEDLLKTRILGVA